MREPAEAPEEPEALDTRRELLRAPDGEALIKENENASTATASNHKIRLIQPTLNDEQFVEIALKIEELKIDPINLVTQGDPDAMTDAIRRGCDPESIKAIIEHVDTLVFNDEAYTRNQLFQLQQSEREDEDWIYELNEKHPVPEGEINPDAYKKASDHVFFKGLSRNPVVY